MLLGISGVALSKEDAPIVSQRCGIDTLNGTKGDVLSERVIS